MNNPRFFLAALRGAALAGDRDAQLTLRMFEQALREGGPVEALQAASHVAAPAPRPAAPEAKQ